MPYHEPLDFPTLYSVTRRGNSTVKRVKAVRLTAILVLAIHTLMLPLFSISGMAWGSDEESATPHERQGHPVMVDGYEIFRIRQDLGAATAQQRADRISAALEELVTAEDYDPNAFKTEEDGSVTKIRYGDEVVMAINDAEANGTGLSRQSLADQYVRLIVPQLARARQQHTPRYLWWAAAYALGTILIYVLVLWLIVAGSRWLLHTIQSSPRAKIPGIKIQESEILRGERLSALLASAVKLLRAVLLAIGTYLVLAAVFGYFPWTRQHGELLLGYIVSPLRSMGRGFLNYLPKLFYIFVIVIVMHYALKVLRLIAGELERGRIRFDNFYPEWVQPTYKIVRFLMFAFAAVIIVPYLPGEDSPAFKGIGVFLGVLFSLGSTSAVSNVVAGIILTYARGFRAGDWVTIGENTGEVVHQSLLATHVRTIRNEEITIPNSVVLGSHVVNFSLQAQEKGVALHTSVTIGYDAPWRTIHKLLIDSALKTRLILHDPQPFVLQAELEDSYVKYEINAYTNRPLEMVYIYSELHSNIQDSFYEAGVEIMSPVFHALRDGNHVAIPDKYLPPDYRAKSFRITNENPVPEGEGGPRP